MTRRRRYRGFNRQPFDAAECRDDRGVEGEHQDDRRRLGEIEGDFALNANVHDHHLRG